MPHLRWCLFQFYFETPNNSPWHAFFFKKKTQNEGNAGAPPPHPNILANSCKPANPTLELLPAISWGMHLSLWTEPVGSSNLEIWERSYSVRKRYRPSESPTSPCGKCKQVSGISGRGPNTDTMPSGLILRITVQKTHFQQKELELTVIVRVSYIDFIINSTNIVRSMKKCIFSMAVPNVLVRSKFHKSNLL